MRKSQTSLSSGDGSAAEQAFAEAVGRAVETFGASGGSVAQAEYSLLRYAAQTCIFQGRSEAKFVELAMKAHQTERKALRSQTKGSA